MHNNQLHRDFWIFYRNLHDQSNIARYLVRIGHPSMIINMPSDDYFSETDVKKFFKQDLAFLESQAKPHLLSISIANATKYGLVSIGRNFAKYYFSQVKSFFQR